MSDSKNISDPGVSSSADDQDPCAEVAPEVPNPIGPMTKPVSTKRMSANRKNAKHSTGPRTPLGKQRVSQNAITHGFMAKTFLADDQEEAIFKEIWEGCREYYQPVGIPEELLVKDIAMSYVLDLRGQRYESGQIRRQLLEALTQSRSQPAFLDEVEDLDMPLSEFRRRSLSSSEEIKFVLSMLEHARRETEARGRVSQDNLARLSKYFGRDWQSLCDVQTILARVQEQMERLEKLKDEMENFETHSKKAQVETLALPSLEVIPNLLRYSAANLNRRHRAMAQLERMQRLRQGEPVPPPLEVNLSSNGG